MIFRILLLTLLALPLHAQESPPPSVTVEHIAPLTASLSGGRDLAITCADDARTYLFFGDSFSGAQREGPSYTRWRPNTGAYAFDDDPTDGLTLVPILGGAALWWHDDEAVTSTPTGCAVAGETVIVGTMEVVTNEGHNFWVQSSGLAISENQARSWAKHTLWEGETAFAQSALVLDGDTLYLLGTEGGRLSSARLARAPLDNMLDPSTYTFWTGEEWSPEMDAAAPVIPGTVGELSVCYNATRAEWLAAYMSPEHNAVVLRAAPELTGAWSAPAVLLSWEGEWDGSYAPQFHPAYCDGDTVYFALSRWRDYNVHWMRLTLED